jgi:hypothetical protein
MGMKAVLKYGCLVTAGLGLMMVAALIFLALKSSPMPSTEEAIATLPESEKAAIAELCASAGIAPKDLRNVNGHDDRLFEFPLNKHAIYVREGHVRGLFLRDVPLSGVPDLSALSGLEVLRMPGCGLSTWPDLSGLKALQHADFSRQPLPSPPSGIFPPRIERIQIAGTNVTDLSSLSKIRSLKDLNASGAPVKSFDALLGLKLDSLDLSNTQVSVLPPTVPKEGEWQVNLDGTSVVDRPGYSPKWPFDGWITDSADGSESSTGEISRDRVEVSGTRAPLAKARTVQMPRCTDPKVPPVTLEVSCMKGKVRVWLMEPPDYFASPWMQQHKVKGFGVWRQSGYVSAIAEPGKPGKVYGRMRLDTRDRIYEMSPRSRNEAHKPPDWCEYSFMIEPLDGGPAEGISYRVSTAP